LAAHVALGPNSTCPGVDGILASHCRGSSHSAITRCLHGSSPIASALALSAPALFVSLSHHACTRNRALRSESTHRRSVRSHHGTSCRRRLCPGTTCRASSTPPENAIAAHITDACPLQETVPNLRLLCVFRPKDPSTPLCLRHSVSHQPRPQKKQKPQISLTYLPGQLHHPPVCCPCASTRKRGPAATNLR